MEVDEFLELMLQSLPDHRKGRTIRLTLVRTSGDFFVSKIHNMRYISIRSIPIERNYRFIVSLFTHEEYQEFKKDFWNDIDFLKIPQTDFEYIPEYVTSIGYDFENFRSVGPGTISLNRPKEKNGSRRLMDYLIENKSKGFDPYHLTFSLSRSKVSVRNDFNFFLKNSDLEIIKLVHKITDFILTKNKEMLDKYASLKIGFKAHEDSFLPLNTHFVELPDSDKRRDLIAELSRKFLLESVESKGGIESAYIFDKHHSESFVRLNFFPDGILLIPTARTKLESLLTFDEILVKEGIA